MSVEGDSRLLNQRGRDEKTAGGRLCPPLDRPYSLLQMRGRRCKARLHLDWRRASNSSSSSSSQRCFVECNERRIPWPNSPRPLSTTRCRSALLSSHFAGDGLCSLLASCESAVSAIMEHSRVDLKQSLFIDSATIRPASSRPARDSHGHAKTGETAFRSGPRASRLATFIESRRTKAK